LLNLHTTGEMRQQVMKKLLAKAQTHRALGAAEQKT
jgi:hypothetical protein